MKPLYLEMSAFGAFGGVEKIDFTKIPPGLFLIYGETGAGKTTVFDAVSYALYGKMSGSIRDTKSVRSDFAQEDTVTYVRFKFQYREEQYEILRSPAYERKKLSGVGTTTEKAKVSLMLPDGLILSDEKSVREKIMDILALNHSQWKQVAMIAQGEFTKCLHTDSEERSAIFRNIFETGIYERLSARLKVDELAAKRKCEETITSVFQYLEAIICDDGNPLSLEFLDTKANRTSDGAAKAVEIVKRLMDMDFESSEALSNECTTIQKRLDEKAAAIENAKAVNRNILELKNETNARDKLLENAPKIKRKEAFVQGAELALTELKELEEQIGKHGAAGLAKEEMNKLENELLLKERAFKEIILRKEELIVSRKQNEASFEKYKDVRLKLIENSNILEKSEGLINDFCMVMDDIKRYNCLRTAYKAAKSDCAAKEKAYKETDAMLSNKRTAFIKGYAGIMAEGLSDGTPCPVCGSASHPCKAVKTGGLPTELELEALEKSVSHALTKWREAEDALRNKEAEGIEIKKTIIKNAGKQIEISADTQITDIYNAIHKAMHEIEQKAGRIKEDIKSLKCDEKVLETAENHQKESEALLEKLSTAERERQEEINLIKTLIAQKQGEYNEIRKSLRYDTKNEAVRRTHSIMIELGLQARDGLTASEAVHTALAAAKTEIDEYKNSIMLTDAKIETLARLAEGRELINLQEIEAETQALKAAKSLREAERSEKLSAYKTNAAIHAKIVQSVDAITEEEKRYSLIERLSKTANGEIKGKQKITLEMYVQRAYFHKILRTANIRLKKMTNGRFELLRKQSASNLRDKSFALDLDVLDNYTGKTRDVSSLSGGETFMAALALALALADTIQAEAGGVEIQTMFIDEGFGSLSPEFLSLVMDTLNVMAYGAGNDKYIGVISHVDELKQGIARQIHVKKSVDGGSRLETV